MFAVIKTIYGKKRTNKRLIGPYDTREEALAYVDRRVKMEGPYSDCVAVERAGWKINYAVIEIEIVNQEEVAELK